MISAEGEIARDVAVRRSRLLADVARASSIIAPLWPLTSFVAVNPLNGLQHLTFDDAAAFVRRWLGARTHLSLAAFRSRYDRGLISDADLRRAIIETDPLLQTSPSIIVGRQSLTPVDVIRLDLLYGPEFPDSPRVASAIERRDPPAPATVLRSLDDLVTGWCALYADEAEVPWAMPGRERGFYRAWRQLAPYDPRVRKLVGTAGLSWLRQLPPRAEDALDSALSVLGVSEEQHVDELRAQLARLPGWAGYARWREEWAPPDHPARPFRLVEILAVKMALEAAVVCGRPSELTSHSSSEDLVDRTWLERRAESLLHLLSASEANPRLVASVWAVLERVPHHQRHAIWLLAQEGSFRERLLAVTRGDERTRPTARPSVQAVFCMDVRSEGLRRHLETVAPYETFGFAGFFAVPMLWQPLGAVRAEPRSPVILQPSMAVAEVAHSSPGDAEAYLTWQRLWQAARESFHAAKGSLGSPFVLAETAGWLAGPLAAIRTLRPASYARFHGLFSFTRPPVTSPALDLDSADGANPTFETLTLAAEALLSTIGLTQRFARLVMLCGHRSDTVNNPHAASLECGACGGAPGGASARVATATLNAPQVRAELESRGIHIPADTWFVAAEHETVTDRVVLLDRHTVPATHAGALLELERRLAEASTRLVQERGHRLPGGARGLRNRGEDWGQTRPELGLAGNAALVIGPRSITGGVNLACRAFLHSYDPHNDSDGRALETILTGPLVVAHWISAQYYFSSVDPEVFGAGDKMLHNPVGGVGVVLGERGDLRVGLPQQSVSIGDRSLHEPLRLLVLVEAPLERTEAVIARNPQLADLVRGRWITLVGRSHPGESWSIRSSAGTWSTCWPADDTVDYSAASLEVV